MEQIRSVLGGTGEGGSEFSADLAAWLSPPRRPEFKVSKRHRSGYRNGFAFGLVCLIVFLVAYFAFTGRLPGPIYLAVAGVTSLTLAIRTWWVEKTLARQENALRYQSHKERYRAYLRRRRIWSRLLHCPQCGCVTDPVAQRKSSLYEVHELVNTRESK